MDEQPVQKESAAEHGLSKEEITSLLTTSPARRGEVLRQEYVQRSISHLLADDQQWSATYGKDLLESLSKTIRAHAYETYDWELRSALLQVWGHIPALYDNKLIHSWLDVQWNELGQLLSLELPEEWYKTAIILLLSTPLAIPPRDITSIANYYNDPFEATLRQLMRTAHTQNMAIRFFCYACRAWLFTQSAVAGNFAQCWHTHDSIDGNAARHRSP